MNKWDYKTPLYSKANGEYYYNEEQLIEIGVDNLDKLQLVICEPEYFRKLDIDYFSDQLPDDVTESPEKLQKAIIDVLNCIIDILPPASWVPGKIAVDLSEFKESVW